MQRIIMLQHKNWLDKKRTTVYIDEDVFKKLKATLAMRGETVSAWFEYQAKRLIEAGAMFPGPKRGSSELGD